MAETDVIVIGAGVAGLACALALADRGLRVTVLEADAVPGGRACSVTDATTGDRVDIGPHILLSEYRHFRALLERLGTAQHVAWQGRRFLLLADDPPLEIRIAPLPAPLHLVPSLLRAKQAGTRDLLSNLRPLWHTLRLTADDVQRLDAIDAQSWLREQGVTAHFIDWFWRTASMTLMNVPLEHCSTGALLRLYRYLMGVHGYEVGLPTIGLGDLFAPAAIPELQRLGSEVRLSTRVEEVLLDADAARGVRLAGGATLHARHVIAAVPPQALLPVLPECWRTHERFSALASVEPSPYISSYLWFDRPVTDERFWSQPWSTDTLHYDFYDLSNIRERLQTPGSLIACNLIWSKRVADWSDERIIAAARRELERFAPRAADATLVHARVHRIAMAIPAPLPGSERLRGSPATPVSGLHLSGDWLDTGLPSSMESAARAAALTAERVLAIESRPASLVQPLPELRGFARWLGHRRLE
ncbi:hydroxysqualene dehydroxylase [Cognatilysobacter bugurensis]|uniref:Oxidoreductase n=1 Tax=Cognatilysobacter bugurensis TaxID=543356 RepID=A0A918T3I2_9GAMM|nr:FAD-dependent oxidoreductase [Lysobacter bugurensis]GHA84473.1 oxidoreductase [Lysobacter bugurensis]